MIKHKKGSVLDLMYLIPIIFLITLAVFFTHKAWGEMSPELRNVEYLDNNESVEAFDTVQTTINGFDLLIPFIFIMGIVVVILLAYYVKASPAFYIVGLFVFIILIVLSTMFSNIFNDFSTASEFENETATYTASVFILQKMPILMCILGALVLIAIYAKFRNAG